MSFWVADYRGDIHVNEGQLGQGDTKILTGNATMTPATDFSKIFHRYILANNTGSSVNLELPAINTALFTLNEVDIGWTAYIHNEGADDILIVTPTTASTVITLKSNTTCYISAKENDGQLVTDWIFCIFEATDGPTGPTGTSGINGTPGPTGPDGATQPDADWYTQGTTSPPTNINDDIFRQGQTLIQRTTPHGSENLHVTGNMVVGNLTPMPISGAYTRTLVIARGFRYGDATTEFDDANVGTFSATFGDSIYCPGANCFAQGRNHFILSTATRVGAFGNGHTGQNAVDSYTFGDNNILGTSSNPQTTYSATFGLLNSVYQDWNYVLGRGNDYIPTTSTTSTVTHNFVYGEGNLLSNAGSITATHNTVMGDTNDLSGTAHIGLGIFNKDNIATGTASYSFCSGRDNTIGGTYSGIIGRGITNNENGCMTMGAFGRTRTEANPSYQLFGGTAVGGSAGDGVGIVGRITATAAVQPTGEIITDTFTTGNADVGEYFEKISSLANTDLTGFFVAFDQTDKDKIRKADSYNNVIGVGSATTLMTGDSAELSWYGVNKKDSLGRNITAYCKSKDFKNLFPQIYGENNVIMKEYYEIEKDIREDNLTAIDNFLNTLPDDSLKSQLVNTLDDTSRDRPICNVISDSYDPQETYIPRSQRPEWQIVGLLGKVYVYDDGTCTIGSKCTVNSEGVATDGDKYYVLERRDNVDESGYGVIKILFF